MSAKRKKTETQEQQRAQQPERAAPSSGKRQKRTAKDESHRAFKTDDTEHSVLGGLSGGYRITGHEKTDPTIVVYKVPINEKFIICEYHAQEDIKGRDKKKSDMHQDGGKQAQYYPELIFTHGAGGGISNPATASFVEGFSRVSPVVAFQGTMNLVSRVKTFHAVIEHEDWGIALGGRSMGARAAVITANESEKGAVKSLVLVSYPLIGGGKSKSGEDIRDGILKELDENVDVLFIVGEQDSMCPLGRLEQVRSSMTASSWLVEVRGADHGMSLKRKTAVKQIRETTGAIAASWLNDRDRNSRHCLIHWDDDHDRVSVSDWD